MLRLSKVTSARSLSFACSPCFSNVSGTSWGHLRRLWEPLGSRLGASWGPLGSRLGASWGPLGASWRPLGASWAPLGRLVGASCDDCCTRARLHHFYTQRDIIHTTFNFFLEIAYNYSKFDMTMRRGLNRKISLRCYYRESKTRRLHTHHLQVFAQEIAYKPPTLVQWSH